MGFNCGIVGLPNVGKSTLFNGLLSLQKAQAANYPFCTIEPNKGIVEVSDPKLYALAQIAKSNLVIPTRLEFVDIAGLVRGAHKGEGLGNQFLANIREVDAIIHVVRCFNDGNIIHVEGNIDPLRDIAIINTELLIADLESLEKRLPNLQKKSNKADKLLNTQIDVIKRIIVHISKGEPVRALDFADEELPIVNSLNLLTTKPVLYICNVDEDSLSQPNTYVNQVAQLVSQEGASYVVICSLLEQELSSLEREDRLLYLESLHIQQTGLDKIISAAYDLLNLQTFFTVGPKEARAWTIPKHTMAQDAAGVIHTDFKRGFIAAEVTSYQDFIDCNGDKGAKELGKTRMEGRAYQVQNGDIILFKFNV